jgi:hypothetical protein
MHRQALRHCRTFSYYALVEGYSGGHVFSSFQTRRTYTSEPPSHLCTFTHAALLGTPFARTYNR